MADTFNRKKRSWIMSRIKGRDTKPEIIVRTILRRMGYRIQNYDKTLPGNPDIVLKNKKKAIFIHGCFWHGHKRCQRSRRPSTNRTFWTRKIDGNMRRDLRVRRQLKRMGWDVLVLWECSLKEEIKYMPKLMKFFGRKTMKPHEAKK